MCIALLIKKIQRFSWTNQDSSNGGGAHARWDDLPPALQRVWGEGGIRRWLSGFGREEGDPRPPSLPRQAPPVTRRTPRKEKNQYYEEVENTYLLKNVYISLTKTFMHIKIG